MTDAARFDDIYNRLNDLTLDVRNLKIQTGTLGSLQVTVSQILNIIIAMQGEMAEVKADVTSVKSDVTTLKTDVDSLKTDIAVLKTDVNNLKTNLTTLKIDMNEVKADISELKSQNAEIIRLLRGLSEGQS